MRQEEVVTMVVRAAAQLEEVLNMVVRMEQKEVSATVVREEVVAIMVTATTYMELKGVVALVMVEKETSRLGWEEMEAMEVRVTSQVK